VQYVLGWLDADKKPIGAGGMGLSYGAVPEWRFMVSLLTAPPDAASVQIRFPMSVNETGRPSSCWLGGVKVRAWPGEAKQGGKTWHFTVAEGAYQQQLFRRVADDDTATGFAVLANPRFTKGPGYLAGGLYTRILPPGQNRAVFRLKRELRLDSLETDAQVACVRHERDKVRGVSLYRGNKLLFRGENLTRAAVTSAP
jgi:hypothetical protein